jgi:hypothetical protein
VKDATSTTTKEHHMKIGDMLKIKGENKYVKEFEGDSMVLMERTCDRWYRIDTVEQMIQSGEATLIPKKESNNA